MPAAPATADTSADIIEIAGTLARIRGHGDGGARLLANPTREEREYVAEALARRNDGRTERAHYVWNGQPFDPATPDRGLAPATQWQATRMPSDGAAPTGPLSGAELGEHLRVRLAVSPAAKDETWAVRQAGAADGWAALVRREADGFALSLTHDDAETPGRLRGPDLSELLTALATLRALL